MKWKGTCKFGPQAPTFQYSPPGCAVPTSVTMWRPRSMQRILNLWREPVGQLGRSCTFRTAHCGEPVGSLCLGAVGLGTLLWQEDGWAWKSLPAVQTHGIQMWLLLGPCILALATLHLAFCLPNTELTVQRAAPMTGGFPGTSLWGHGEAQIPCVPLLSQIE